MMFRLLFFPFALAIDASLAVLESLPPHKRYKNGKGFPKPRMMDALRAQDDKE